MTAKIQTPQEFTDLAPSQLIEEALKRGEGTLSDTGALLVNYSGHGSHTGWASELIVDNRGPDYREDVEDELGNTGKYPLVVSMSCMNGYFAYPEAWTTLYNYNYHSLGEALMRADGKLSLIHI